MIPTQFAQSIVIYTILVIGYTIASMLSGVGAAWITYFLGDETAHDEGYTSPNPTLYLNFVGLLVIMVLKWGWATLIPIDTTQFRHQNRTLKSIIAYAAQPLIASLVALLTLTVLVIRYGSGIIYYTLGTIISHEAPIGSFAAAFPNASSLEIILALLLTAIVFYSIIIVPIVIFGNVFRIVMAHLSRNHPEFAHVSPITLLIIGIIFISLAARPMLTALFYGITRMATYLGSLFGAF